MYLHFVILKIYFLAFKSIFCSYIIIYAFFNWQSHRQSNKNRKMIYNYFQMMQ